MADIAQRRASSSDLLIRGAMQSFLLIKSFRRMRKNYVFNIKDKSV